MSFDWQPPSALGLDPVLANRAEYVELERILERLGLVRSSRRNVQHLTFANQKLLTPDETFQGTLQDVGHLLALVRVHRYECAALQIDLRKHFTFARDDLLRDHFGNLVERNLVPAMDTDGSHGLPIVP